MSTLREIKAAAATLPAEERSELAAWLSKSDDVSRIRAEQLRREIQIGLNEVERGEVAPLDIAEVKRKARARLNFSVLALKALCLLQKVHCGEVFV